MTEKFFWFCSSIYGAHRMRWPILRNGEIFLRLLVTFAKIDLCMTETLRSCETKDLKLLRSSDDPGRYLQMSTAAEVHTWCTTTPLSTSAKTSTLTIRLLTLISQELPRSHPDIIRVSSLEDTQVQYITSWAGASFYLELGSNVNVTIRSYIHVPSKRSIPYSAKWHIGLHVLVARYIFMGRGW